MPKKLDICLVRNSRESLLVLYNRIALVMRPVWEWWRTSIPLTNSTCNLDASVISASTSNCLSCSKLSQILYALTLLSSSTSMSSISSRNRLRNHSLDVYSIHRSINGWMDSINQSINQDDSIDDRLPSMDIRETWSFPTLWWTYTCLDREVLFDWLWSQRPSLRPALQICPEGRYHEVFYPCWSSCKLLW